MAQEKLQTYSAEDAEFQGTIYPTVDYSLRELENYQILKLNNNIINILSICKDFFDLFYLSGDKLTFSTLNKHSITTTSEKPIYLKQYRLSHAQQAKIQKQVDDMIHNDIIETSGSP